MVVRASLLCWLLRGLLWSSTAAAQSAAEPATSSAAPTDDEDGRLHFELARRAYARADYETALDEFRASYALSNRPELHYNLFLVYHELDRDEEAAAELRLYLATDAVEEEARGHLEARLARLDAALAAEAHGAEATSEPETTEAPADTIAIGEAVEIAPTEAIVRDDTLLHAGIATLGGAVLVLAGFGVTGGLSMAERDALTTRCAPACAAEDTRTGRDLALAADVMLGTGVALAAAGGVLLGLGLATGSESSPSVAIAASPTSATVTVTGSL